MKIIYKNTELQHNTKSYNSLINKPSLNGKLLQGNVSLDTLSLYDKPAVEKLVESVSQIRLVSVMPADPEPSMTYYVGPDERDLYDVILVNDAKQQIPMGTTQFGQYKSGMGVNVKVDNTININTDDVSVYIDSEGNIASSLDGEALPAFIGATASTAGQKGLVPKPLRGQQDYALFGDSTWKEPIEIIKEIYPIGALLLTYTSSTDPNILYPGTTWTKLSSGYVLWNDTNGGGGTISAAMPNITGHTVNMLTHNPGGGTHNGALYNYTYGTAGWAYSYSESAPYGDISIDLSASNPIFGNSNTVQPPVTTIVAWQRTA